MGVDFDFGFHVIPYSNIQIDIDDENNKGKLEIVFKLDQNKDPQNYSLLKGSVELVKKFYAQVPDLEFNYIEDKDNTTHRIIFKGESQSIIEISTSLLLMQVDIGEIKLKDLLGPNGLQIALLQYFANESVKSIQDQKNDTHLNVEGDKDGDYSYR